MLSPRSAGSYGFSTTPLLRNTTGLPWFWSWQGAGAAVAGSPAGDRPLPVRGHLPAVPRVGALSIKEDHGAGRRLHAQRRAPPVHPAQPEGLARLGPPFERPAASPARPGNDLHDVAVLDQVIARARSAAA